MFYFIHTDRRYKELQPKQHVIAVFLVIFPAYDKVWREREQNYSLRQVI